MTRSAVIRRYIGSFLPNRASTIETGTAPDPQGNFLLSRLPLEIRLQIWGEVVGVNLFHMSITQLCPQKSNLRCSVCWAFYRSAAPTQDGTPPVGDVHARCQGSQQEPCFFSGPENTPFSRLSLLLSCRQIYEESVHLLYATNTFNIDNLETLQSVIQVMGPRIGSIRVVHVNTAMWKIHCYEINRISDEAFEEWSKFWHLLATRFPGLQHVRLDIYGTSRAGLQPLDLKPLLELRGLKSFDLALWQDTKDRNLPEQGSMLVGPMQMIIRSHICQESSP